MNRPILMCAFFAVTVVALSAQDSSQSNPYEGRSTPPAEDEVITTVVIRSKPMPGQQIYVQSSVPANSATPGQRALAAQRAQADVQVNSTAPVIDQAGDDAIVAPPPDPSMSIPDPLAPLPRIPTPASFPALTQRTYDADPDGDIVRPRVTRPGEIPEGTTIRVRLLHKLSTAYNERGEEFKTKVASDVVQGSQVLIPAGAEIDGRLLAVSKGHTGGYGTMRLKPENVILPDGTRYHLSAEMTGAPGSGAKIVGEGTVRAGSRLKKDGFEYGGAVGGGAVAGAFIGGPVGALTGGLVGAGFATVHILVSHPQATLNSGTALLFTLTEPLYMYRGTSNGD